MKNFSKNLSSTEFNPFNHGTTSASFRAIKASRYKRLSDILSKGWNIQNVEDIKQACEGAEKSSNNYRVISNSKSFLLKHSHINNSAKQNLVNRCLTYCEQKGIPTSHLISTREGESYFVNNKEIYCLYDFIDGEHFDGSQMELKEMAASFARFHTVLKNIPYEAEIKSLKGELISHNREELKKIIEVIKLSGGKSDFDRYVYLLLDEIDAISKEISFAGIDQLPIQVVHYDLHPHNFLFDKGNQTLKAYLDFDPMIYSQRIRDVGFAMHRFARTYGKKTERQIDIGVDIRERAKLFLKIYQQTNKLEDEEIRNIPVVIQDEALRRVMIILGKHYLKKDLTWDFDLIKQIIILKEGSLFSF